MSQHEVSRRDFVKVAGATAASLAAVQSRAWAQGSDVIRIGLIGCGGRGTGAAEDCLGSAENLKIVAIGDLFADRMNGAKDRLRKKGDQADLPDERCFSGFDAYQKVIDSDVHLIVTATPPGFRPLHFEAAVQAGKHVFMEKPVAVDPVGCRRVMAAADLATEKKLSVVAGTQRRHDAGYQETVKRIRDGQIGDIVAAQAYWNQGGLWKYDRRDGMSDVEWQIRNWLYFAWTSGDHIVEQHVHNLDVINWCMGTHPVKCLGMGGRQVRTDPAYGHIYDHFTIEYEYPGGARMMSMCRQQAGTASRVSENVIGTKGVGNPGGWLKVTGGEEWRFNGQRPGAYQQEHRDLIASIRGGAYLNEGRQVAESTLTAVMGRLSAYSGQEVTWDQMMKSTLDLTPPKYEFGELAMPEVAQPGRYRLT
ncbi:MAG: Gfo/Idh/MocA family oxidoreductase [Fimbriimonadaceae bacterium]|nr:Gfo/Idh/MocA family oxidoreductase [Fimbriimonadaceae bacterium]